MKHSMAKLGCLLLALLLTLTGCNLIHIDGVMQAHENLEKIRPQYETVLAEYDGGSVNMFDVTLNFTSYYSYMSQMYYYFYGQNLTNDDVASMQQEILQNAVATQVMANHASEIGVALTDEEIAECNATAESNYEQNLTTALADAQGDNDAEKQAYAEYALYTSGITKEFLQKQEQDSVLIEKIQEALRNEITDVTEEELQTAYDEKVAADKETYETNAGSYGSSMTGADFVAYYVPEGYRTVKHILVIPEEDVLSAVTDARNAVTEATDSIAALEEELANLTAEDAEATDSERTAEVVEQEIAEAKAKLPELEAAQADAEAACLASVQAKLDEIYARIDAEEDFDALIAEYGEDPGMQNDPCKTIGYYVSEASANWDASFKAASLALAAIGDVSEPVISASGIHIIRYESDVVAGEIGLDNVRHALYEETLETLKDDHFATIAGGWVTDANPTYYYDRWVYPEV